MQRKMKQRNKIQIKQNLAREGHLIYCYGDCERKYQEALDSLREAHTGDVLKDMWLDVSNTRLQRIHTTKSTTKPNEQRQRKR